ncbi:putative lipase [Stipitochalara longipes BDJ]|nr:putative lipase [Stipitochalara longipes BDJ]
MYTYAAVLATAISVLLFNIQPKSDSSLVTDLRTNVSYQGISKNGLDSFLNIPFGQDTGGLGRFAPPKPYIPAHNTIINAMASGPICPQVLDTTFPIPTSPVTNISEDCLNLRITRPSSTLKSSRLPVMVYIYGGGYSTGQIYDTLYTPDQLVLDSVKNGSPVIYAAMNYRLGIFGFANNKILRQKRSLNVGLRDQRLALEWIQENIAAFGGDPDRVTIFGESAGATSVILQLSAFGGESRPPFQKAMVESFALGPGFTNETSGTFMDILQASGCTYHDPNSALSLDCLKSLSLESLLQAEVAVSAKDSFNPIVDGDFIPAAPSTLFQTERISHVPLVIGWNNNDDSFFLPASIETEDDTIAFLQSAGLTNTTIHTILNLYPLTEFHGNPAANHSSQWTRASRIGRDLEFTCPSIFFAMHESSRQMLTHKHRTLKTPPSPPVFLYHLNQAAFSALLNAEGFPGEGVSHVADIPYVFDEVSQFDDKPADEQLAKHVSGSWSRFANSGQPSSSKGTTIKGWLPAWEEDTVGLLERAKVMVIGGGRPGLSGLVGEGNAIANQKLAKRCAFLLGEEVLRDIGL